MTCALLFILGFATNQVSGRLSQGLSWAGWVRTGHIDTEQMPSLQHQERKEARRAEGNLRDASAIQVATAQGVWRREDRKVMVLVVRVRYEGPKTRPSVWTLLRDTVGSSSRFWALRWESEFCTWWINLPSRAWNGSEQRNAGRKDSGGQSSK